MVWKELCIHLSALKAEQAAGTKWSVDLPLFRLRCRGNRANAIARQARGTMLPEGGLEDVCLDTPSSCRVAQRVQIQDL